MILDATDQYDIDFKMLTPEAFPNAGTLQYKTL